MTSTNPPAFTSLPTELAAADHRASAWLCRHIEADPDLAEIFDDASHTTWLPLINFVRWAVRHNLLRNLPGPTPDPDAGAPPHKR